MRSDPPRLARLFHLCWSFALISCDTQTEVSSTIPRAGQDNVDPRTVVAVAISNSITADDSAATDPKNFVVTGDFTQGAYSGTIVTADRDQVFNGQTVDEFDVNGQGEAADGADAPEERKNTLVFLLPDGVSFKSGETIRVRVDHDVTANGTPLRKHKIFSFRIEGSSGSSGDLRVTSTEPRPGTVGALNRARVVAAFNRAVKGADLGQGITIRGSQTGVHSEGQVVHTTTQGEGRVLKVTNRLANDDSFAFGELVTVAMSSSISEAQGAGQQNSAKLTPFAFQFQVRAGKVGSGWSPLTLPPPGSSPAAVTAADFVPETDGTGFVTEFVVVGSDRISLFARDEGQSWSAITSPIPLGESGDGFRGVDGAAYDTDGDGVPEVVVLLAGTNQSRLMTFKVDDQKKLVPSGKSSDIPVIQPSRMLLADLDGNGKPEALISHPETRYTPGPGNAQRSTGNLTFLELRLVPPDLADIDPADPTTALPFPKFEPVHNPISGFPLSRRIQAADLNNDGKLDLISQTDAGVSLYRNIGDAATQFAFRAVQELPGRTESHLLPSSWLVADLDQDGDQDVLAWDSQGALLYRNPVVVPDDSGSGPASPAGLLGDSASFEPVPGLPVVAAGAASQALDLDGAGGLDLVIEADGIILFRASEQGALTFARFDIGGTSPTPLAIADVDGDSGLDLVRALPAGEVQLQLSQDVERPFEEAPSAFRIAPLGSGLTKIVGEEIEVAILGDLEERFNGYTVALDYDEQVLSYRGFVIPKAFERTASFTLCPDKSSQGCGGNASASMSYPSETRGDRASGVLLGTFRFALPDVNEPVTTQIELESFTGANNAKFENALTVVDGTAKVSVPVEIEGEPLSIDLEPPPPADLVVECAVLDRDEATLEGQVSWASPVGLLFAEFRVHVEGNPEEVLPGTAASHVFSTPLAGPIDVTVTGRIASGGEAAAQCQVIGIHQPSVDCARDAAASNAVRVTWTISHTVDRFQIYRNGSRLPDNIQGGQREFLDSGAPARGAITYEVAAVLFDERGPKGSCGPIPDPQPGPVLPPQITEASLVSRAQASDPNTIRLRWTNGEGYDLEGGLTLTLRRAAESQPFETRMFEGTADSFTFRGGNPAPPGGVRPQQYVFSLVGRVQGRESEKKESSVVTVPVPTLSAVPFTCLVDQLANVVLEWTDLWQGYTGLKLVTEHRIGDGPPVTEETELSLESTRLALTGLAPAGAYTFRLRAAYTEPLPAALTPLPGALERSCSVSFESSVLVGRVEAGVGMPRVEVPVRAKVLGVLRGFHFELEFPSFLTVDAASGLIVDYPGAVTKLSVTPGESAGTSKAVVDVSGIDVPPDLDGDGVADGEVRLATLIGSTQPDFGIAGESPLLFRGETSLQFAGVDEAVPVEADDGGVLSIVRRYVMVDKVSIPAGSPEIVRLGVTGTFNASPSNPDYRLNSFQIRLKWDPSLLEILPITAEDQQETVVGNIGAYFLPAADAIATARTRGDIRVGWLGFNLANPNLAPVFLEPGIGLKLLFVKFRSKVPGNAPSALVGVDFVSAPISDEDRFITALFPEIADPTLPDLEGFFGGGVEVRSSVAPFTVRSINPIQGSLLGRNEAVIEGTGFLTAGLGSAASRIELVHDAAITPRVLRVTEILAVEASRLVLKVPDSTLRSPSRLSNPVDIRITTPSGNRTLVRAYSYEAPRLSGLDPVKGPARGGDLVAIRGAGLSPNSTVVFRVRDVVAPFPAEVARVESDGTRILVRTPDLRGHETKKATVEVTVPLVATVALADAFEILRDSGQPTLKLESIEPAAGSICGGQVVTIKGEGLLDDTLSVQFGNVPASSVELVSGGEARVTTPRMTEGTGAVDVKVMSGDGLSAVLPGGFTFTHPDPPFVRGDVNEDLRVDITDAVKLADLVLGKAVTFPANLDAADANDDGFVNGGDATTLTRHLFGGLGALPAPFPSAGLDTTPDELTSCRE